MGVIAAFWYASGVSAPMSKGRRGGGSWGPALDGEGAIGLLILAGIVLLPIVVIVGIGWLLWQGYLFVLEGMLGKCRHDAHAVYKPEHRLRFCGECGMWQTVEKSQMALDYSLISGPHMVPIEELEWHPSETRPKYCDHPKPAKIVGNRDDIVGICPDCGCWREHLLTDNKKIVTNTEYWEPADTLPVGYKLKMWHDPATN